MNAGVGASVSTVATRAADAALVLPAASASVAVKLWVASARVPVVKLQVPMPFAVALPSCVAPSNILTVLLASAVPVSVSTAASVMPSPTVPVSGENAVMVGAGGAVVPKPITPSPFRSWWKLVSSDSSVELVPDTTPIIV